MKRSGHRACAELKITFNGRMLHRVIPRMTLIKFRSKKRSIKLYKLLGTSNFFVYMSHDVYLNFSCTHCSCNLSRLFFFVSLHKKRPKNSLSFTERQHVDQSVCTPFFWVDKTYHRHYSSYVIHIIFTLFSFFVSCSSFCLFISSWQRHAIQN